MTTLRATIKYASRPKNAVVKIILVHKYGYRIDIGRSDNRPTTTTHHRGYDKVESVQAFKLSDVHLLHYERGRDRHAIVFKW